MKTGNFVRLRITWRGLLFYLPLVVLFLQALKTNNRRKRMTTTNKIGYNVYSLLVLYGFSPAMAKIITAQAAHETGNFTSKIFKENNNLFGMKLPNIRQTYAKGEKYGHAIFNDIEDSIKDFVIYFQNFRYVTNYTSIEKYISKLKENKYFQADEKEYLNGVKAFYNLYFEDVQKS